ncbi:MAG: phosphoenolpyruvate--protein phosphotransferase [Erysipelothrix sp.]|nr:phosphoenolpyruvate--protein phosphotransferase [Erysipelothrix sp.]
MFKGIAASSGVAISKVYKLERPVLVVNPNFSDLETELKIFSESIEKTKVDIEKVKSKAVGRLSDDELAIFDAHLMVASDPEFIGQIEEQIRNGFSVSTAVENVKSMFVGMFEAMEDEYFRERAADIKDVTYRLLAHTLNVKIPDLSLIDEEVIIVAHDLTPSDTAQLDRQYVKGFATEIGGRTSHSAIMARSLEIPAVVGIKGVLENTNNDDVIILDALTGDVLINPENETIDLYRKKEVEYAEYRESLKQLISAESVTVDGHRVEIAGNIGNAKDVVAVLENGGDGVGLYRTEFLYMDATSLPSEEDQYNAYKAVLEAMGDKLVVIRTLDIGGDKELSYLKFPHELNPFLGYRALRLCLDRPDIFRTQLRALLRASVHGKLAIMFPMVATVNEFRAAKALLEDERKNLTEEGIAVSDQLQVGIMIEIPAAAVNARNLAKEADFFSIGTNDLIQYTMAADRMNQQVSYLYQPYNPSILSLIKMAIDGAHAEGKWCGMCGEMAGEELAVPVLLGLGLDEFSMSATSILAARKMVRSLNYQEMKDMANRALECGTQEEVLDIINGALSK